jgi:beta-RFAP synthase
MPRIVEIHTPSRLHFGMLSFGQPDVRRFGGVGVMIDQPRTAVRVTHAERFVAAGPEAERAAEFARRVAQTWGLAEDLPCRLEVASAPRRHTGLGSGTQLALAVAAALHALFDRPVGGAVELASAVGRGLRSAVGTYGFEQGGLLVEAGKWRDDDLSPLVARLELPLQWRFVLVTPRRQTGLHGQSERTAFEQLPPVSRQVTERLCAEVLLHLLPAAATGDFPAFSDSLYRYGYQAGLCFQSRQHSAFATPQLEQLANWIRDQGASGIGQSSWGPTLFALTPSQTEAEQLVRQLTGSSQGKNLDHLIARPEALGATISIDNQPPQNWRSCLGPQ